VTVRGFVRPTMPTAGGTGEADRRRAAAGPTPREPGSYRRRVVFDPLQKAHAGRSSHVARRTSHVARPTTHDPRPTTSVWPSGMHPPTTAEDRRRARLGASNTYLLDLLLEALIPMPLP
jgi:hypothetical protein